MRVPSGYRQGGHPENRGMVDGGPGAGEATPHDSGRLVGKRGPKPVPDEVKRARGNPGHRVLNDQAPVLPAADLTPPAGLGAAGLKMWNHYGPMWSEAGVLTAGDMLCFETACRVADDVDRYTQAAAAVGAEAAHRLGYAGHLLRLRDQLKRYLETVGGTPTSRSAVKVSHVGWAPKETPAAAASVARKKRFFGPKLHRDPPASA